MKIIDLIVIGDIACGTTRAYLSYMYSVGLKPKELWLTRFIPASSRVKAARKWPFGANIGNYFLKKQEYSRPVYDPIFSEICEECQKAALIPIDFCNDFDYGKYVSKLKLLSVEDFQDPYLHKLILKNSSSAFLYTNGGIVPNSILANPEVKIFHIHPGVVPIMRGSDCFLWSLLVRKNLGASCFYMSAGIDEGRVIATADFSVPDLRGLRKYFNRDSEEIVYRALALSLDPHIRAMLFTNIIVNELNGSSLKQIKTNKQDLDEHYPYLWMHPSLRYKVIKDLIFNDDVSVGHKLEIINS